MSEPSNTVLIVDDDEETVELFETWLSDHYDVKTTTDDEATLAELEGCDVVVLDRALPIHSRDDVAAGIGRRDHDCMTAIVSGVEPDTDTVHISCGTYLAKPITESELLEIVDRLRQRARYDDRLAECANLAAKRGALEAARRRTALEDDPEYVALCRRLRDLRAELDELIQEFDDTDFHAAFETPDFTGGPRIQQLGWIT